ncbi:MAG: SLC13 family permease, partial [Planctomycetales bacterium]|nr:SLC13 family permease [Planctomycetales bacterium]
MNPHAILAILTTLSVFVALVMSRRAPTDLLFMGGVVFVTLCGIITPAEALQGFASAPILTIGGLLICAAGLRTTGVLDWAGHRLLGTVMTEGRARARLAAVLLAFSAFVLNTAVVAMFMPVVVDWSRKRQISPSRVLLPLSYLAILGGVCTLVGTSTTLVVNAKLREEHALQQQHVAELAQSHGDPEELEKERRVGDQLAPMPLFEIGRVGLPCALVGTVVLLLTAPWVLPNRREFIERLEDQRREYLLEMRVEPNCRLIGQTVEEAGLRHLPGLFLIEISRDSEVIAPVAPGDHIRSGDRLVFTGIVSTIVDLEKIPGLVPVTDMVYDLDSPGRHLAEVVLSPSCPVIGSTVRDASFRRRYGAAIVAVHRNGVRLTNKIGDIILEPGDTLLLQTRGDFVANRRNSRDFYLVSAVEGSSPRRHERALWAAALGLGLVLWLSLTSFLPKEGMWLGFASTAVAAIAVAGLMVVCRCLPISQARSAIDLQLLITIAGALGLATAIDKSGADDMIAESLIAICGQDPWVLLIVLYVLAMVFTEMVTNNAVAATLIPLAIATAREAHHNPRPFIMAISLAASLSFLTPIGYQTNLMVMGAGGYRAQDYLRAGTPIALSVAVTAI